LPANTLLTDPWNAEKRAEAKRAPERVVKTIDVIKSAVTAGSTQDGNWASALSAYRQLTGAFVEALRTESAFDAMFDSMVALPLLTQFAAMSLAGTETEVNEGVLKPITSMSFESLTLEPRKVVSIAVFTNQFLRTVGGGIVNAIGREMRAGMGVATDRPFLGSLASTATSIPATGGSDFESIANQLEQLLAAVETGNASRVFLVLAPHNVKVLALRLIQQGISSVGLNGGELAGARVVVTSAAGDNVFAIDATGIAGNRGEIQLATTSQADLRMADDSMAGAAQMTSLFQTNSTALRCERVFGFTVIRDTAAAVLSDVSWGSVDSPV
jgi:hypothetical protein